jgi:glycosyltransferase involved in cell wall biosynthesis
VVGDAALLVPPDDPGGWADAIERLLRDADLRAVLASQGIVQAARFAYSRVAATTLAVLERAVQP